MILSVYLFRLLFDDKMSYHLWWLSDLMLCHVMSSHVEVEGWDESFKKILIHEFSGYDHWTHIKTVCIL